MKQTSSNPKELWAARTNIPAFWGQVLEGYPCQQAVEPAELWLFSILFMGPSHLIYRCLGEYEYEYNFQGGPCDDILETAISIATLPWGYPANPKSPQLMVAQIRSTEPYIESPQGKMASSYLVCLEALGLRLWRDHASRASQRLFV